MTAGKAEDGGWAGVLNEARVLGGGGGVEGTEGAEAQNGDVEPRSPPPHTHNNCREVHRSLFVLTQRSEQGAGKSWGILGQDHL